MKERIIAIVSIVWMVFAASSPLIDNLLLTYAVILIYTAMRWKLSEKEMLTVGGNTSLWLTRSFLVVCCIIFAATGSTLGATFQTIHPIFGGICSLVGFALAFDVGRCFKKIQIART